MNSKCVFILVSALIVEIGTIISDTSHVHNEAGDKDYTVSESRNPENILCRGCGSDVSSANFVVSKLSPSSHYAFNDTLFNREKVLVQIVSHDFIFQFPVITLNQSTCQGFGEWQVDDSWFPGYHWKVCVCPDCGEFLGWVFEPIYPGRVNSPDEVFCLVLTSVIGESCNYILNQEGCCGYWFRLLSVGSLLCIVGSRTCPICLFYCHSKIIFLSKLQQTFCECLESFKTLEHQRQVHEE